MSCPSGQIKRSSYKRSSYKKKSGTVVKSSRVPATCITDVGKPGKGVKLFEVTKPNLLRNYGYTTDKPMDERKSSLKRAMSRENPLEVLRHLNAIRTLNKPRREIYDKMDKDMKYVQKEYKRISKKTSKKRTSKKSSKRRTSKKMGNKRK